MKQLSINVAKDVTIDNLACTPNVILLAKQTTTIRNGEVSTTVRYIEVCKVDKTDSLTIVQTMLKYCIAEFCVAKELETDFSDTNIKQRKIFNQFLTTNTIYRTDSNGKITNALVSEVPFSQTALKVKDTHTITNCKPENLKAAIYQHSKAILSQCKYLRLIIDKVATLETVTTKTAKPATKKIAQNVGGTVATATPPAS